MSNDSSSRIVADLQRWIAQAPAGARLPSSRALVAEYTASPVTVQQAIRALRHRGLVETRPGAGTFVRRRASAGVADYGWQTAALGAQASPVPRSAAALRTTGAETIALHAGFPDRSLLPERLLRSAFARAARSEAALSRAPISGLPELRAWFATELRDGAPDTWVSPGADDVIVTPGSQAALGAIFHSLVGPGNPLLIESPSYWGAMLAAARVGVRLVPVPSGVSGPDPAELERALVETGARAFYAQPNFANPHGAQWSPALGDRVLELMRAHGAFLIEDDWAHDFGISAASAPLAARDGDGHVVYLRSLTKSVSPAARVAAIIARGPARDRLVGAVQADNLYVSPLLQSAALDVVSHGGWRPHLRGLGEQLANRRDLLLDALDAHAPAAQVEAIPRGGLNLWARLPDRIDPDRLARDCEADGLMIAVGDAWFPSEPTGPFLRLNFSGPAPERYPEAARILGRAIEAQHGDGTGREL